MKWTIIPDFINGAFELWGGLFILLNCRKLYQDKEVKGIHWGSTIFFTSWGLWNLYYYPFLGQWASTFGGVVICAANLLWLLMRLYYAKLRYWKNGLKERWQCTCSNCSCIYEISTGYLCGACAEDCSQTSEWWNRKRR